MPSHYSLLCPFLSSGSAESQPSRRSLLRTGRRVIAAAVECNRVFVAAVRPGIDPHRAFTIDLGLFELKGARQGFMRTTKNTKPVSVDKRSTTLNAGRLSGPEPGTCNVCCAPCSLCLHNSQAETVMESNFTGSSGIKEEGCMSAGKHEVNAQLHNELRQLSDSNDAILSTGSWITNDMKPTDESLLSATKSPIVKSSDTNGMFIKDNAAKSEENPLPAEDAMHDKDNAQSDIEVDIEVDVKVCDICGDQGLEDSLTICTRCGDGAEHIYCMKVMLDKVPKGEWLCEECKLVEQSGRERNADVSPGEKALGADRLDWNSQELADESRHPTLDSKESNLVCPNDVAVTMKDEDRKQVGSNEKPSTPLTSGALMKSTSFNNLKVPKVKQLSVVPPKQNATKEVPSNFRRKYRPNPSIKDASSASCDVAETSKSMPRLLGNEQPLLQGSKLDVGTSLTLCHPLTKNPSGFCVPTPKTSTRLVPRHMERKKSDPTKPSQEAAIGTAVIDISQSRDVGMSTKSMQPSQGGFCLWCKKSVHFTHFCTATKIHVSAMPKSSSAAQSEAAVGDKSSSQLAKSTTQVSLDRVSTFAGCLLAFAVPEPDFIWQGCFDVSRTGKPHETCAGVQAYLSSHASMRVAETATKFPTSVLLEEAPRQDFWPSQFQSYGLKEDSIALFFFADNTDSYESHYCRLVENTSRNDLVLRADIGPYELLVFPSHILPEKAQTWNKLYFLWGIFRISPQGYPKKEQGPRSKIGGPITLLSLTREARAEPLTSVTDIVETSLSGSKCMDGVTQLPEHCNEMKDGCSVFFCQKKDVSPMGKHARSTSVDDDECGGTKKMRDGGELQGHGSVRASVSDGEMMPDLDLALGKNRSLPLKTRNFSTDMDASSLTLSLGFASFGTGGATSGHS